MSSPMASSAKLTSLKSLATSLFRGVTGPGNSKSPSPIYHQFSANYISVPHISMVYFYHFSIIFPIFPKLFPNFPNFSICIPQFSMVIPWFLQHLPTINPPPIWSFRGSPSACTALRINRGDDTAADTARMPPGREMDVMSTCHGWILRQQLGLPKTILGFSCWRIVVILASGNWHKNNNCSQICHIWHAWEC